jgi:uncharacterized protein (TIGR03083 family)
MLTYDAQRSLEIMGREQERLCERLARLTDAQLQSASNLPGWSIADMLVHTTRVCDSLLMAVKRATVGDRTPVFGPTSAAREDEIRAMGPAGWAALQRGAHAELTQVVSGLSSEQIEQSTFPFGPGERNIAWFCTQNLAEVAYHRWDLDWSLGQRDPLDDDLAAYLLPFLLDAQRLLFWRKRTDGEPQTFALSTDSQTWVLHVTSDGTTVAPPGTAAQVIIAAPPGWLALAAYGRVSTTGPAFRVTGPNDASQRFAAIFGPAS